MKVGRSEFRSRFLIDARPHPTKLVVFGVSLDCFKHLNARPTLVFRITFFGKVLLELEHSDSRVKYLNT